MRDSASTHPNNTVISGALVNNMSQWSISLSDEPSGGVSAFMHIQADTNLEAQEVGFELDLPENVYAELCVRQYVDTGEEYTNVVAWTTINTSGAQSFMVPINKAYVQAGGPTMLRMTFRTVGNVNLGTGTATQWKNYYTYLSHYVSQTHIATICEEKDNYRFGFNGQEKVNEVAGIGNHNTALFWEYDTRTARRWNLDPVDQINISNYAVLSLNPITQIDPLGNTDDNIYVNDIDKTFTVQRTNDPYDRVIEGKYDKKGNYTNTPRKENGVEKYYKPGTYHNKLKSEGYSELRGAQSEEFLVEMAALEGAGKLIGKGLGWGWSKFSGKATIAVVNTVRIEKATAFTRTETIGGNKAARAVGDIMKKMKAGEKMPAIKVFEQDGKRYVLDGHHRLEAATRLGQSLEYETVTAEQLSQYGYKNANEVVQAASEAGASRVKIDNKIVNQAAGQ